MVGSPRSDVQERIGSPAYKVSGELIGSLGTTGESMQMLCIVSLKILNFRSDFN